MHMFTTPLGIAVSIGLVGVVLELLMAAVRIIWLRQALAFGVILVTAFAAALVLSLFYNVFGALVFFIAAYRVLNACRVVYGRSDPRRNLAVTRRTSLMLLAYQMLSILLLVVDAAADVSSNAWLVLALTASLIAAVATNYSLHRTLGRSQPRTDTTRPSIDDLPTISVCIPARNETDDLVACLESVLASDYPKLEVLVLDDCSHAKTSEIIRGFANKGVRFIGGEPPREGWLAKNQAYQALAEAASSDYLLFCGVDVRFSIGSIRAMLTDMRLRDKHMVSVMPAGRQYPGLGQLIQPMRYWWELGLPRRLFNRPPALSTAWLIEKRRLAALGGFKAVSNMVVPESYFARELVREDGYSFLRSAGELQLQSVKGFPEQWATALRTRYPQARKRPESVLVIALGEVFALLLPFAVLVWGIVSPLGAAWLLAAVSCLLLAAAYYRIITAWQTRHRLIAACGLPAALLLELFILHYSMWKYEFSQVGWKQRNICIPVMQAIKHLPKL